MTFGFLIDENYSHDVADLLAKLLPDLVIRRVGQPPAPPKGTPDPDLLEYADANDFLMAKLLRNER